MSAPLRDSAAVAKAREALAAVDELLDSEPEGSAEDYMIARGDRGLAAAEALRALLAEIDRQAGGPGA